MRSPLRLVRRSRHVAVPEGVRPVSHCQELQGGWDQERLKTSCVWLAGAGGLGAEIALALVQAGLGDLVTIDPDTVEESNLNRQLFSPDDVGERKALALARNVTEFGGLKARVTAEVAYVEDYLEEHEGDPPDALVVGVDNDGARLAAQAYCLEHGIPLVNVGLSEDGAGLQVAVHEVGGACIRCLAGEGESVAAPCGGLPVDKTLCQLAGGLAARAVLSVLMPSRPRTWRVFTMFPDTGVALSGDCSRRVDCSLCSGLTPTEAAGQQSAGRGS